MPRRSLAGSLLILAALAACSPSEVDLPAEKADAQTAWLRTHAHRLALEGENFDDLDFLRPLLRGKRIVQLGENTHGVREYNRIKARLVQYLHQELGYEVLAMESAFYQCYDANLTAAESSALSTLRGCAMGVWHTQEVLPLFEYLRRTHQGERPLLLAGIDVQPIGPNKADRPSFLSRAVARFDPDFAKEAFQLDSTFLEIYARGSRERRTYFRQEAGQRMAQSYDRLADFLAEKAAGLRESNAQLDGGSVLVAARTAASMSRYIRQQSAPTTREYVEHRDQGMAENLMFLLDEFYPDKKVIVWGHNFHIRHDNLKIAPDASIFPDVAARTMGSWIRQRYGAEVYTVGFYAHSGQAYDNGGEVYEFAPAEPGSLEALLHEIGAEAVFVDLSQSPRKAETAWMDEPLSARYNGTTALEMILRSQYDAILFIDQATPRLMIQ